MQVIVIRKNHREEQKEVIEPVLNIKQCDGMDGLNVLITEFNGIEHEVRLDGYTDLLIR